jgi:hypothetical protein
MKTKIGSLCVVVLALAIRHGEALEITQPLIGGGQNITQFSPMGQTFIAEDPHLSSIGFYVQSIDQKIIGVPPPGPTTTFTYSLFAENPSGPLFSGSPLATSQAIEPTAFTGYADAYFSGVTLNVGQQYVVLINSSWVDTLLFHNQIAPTEQPTPTVGDYTGGEMIFQGQLQPLEDATFRIEGVPEAGSAWLYPIAAGFLYLASRRFRRAGQS